MPIGTNLVGVPKIDCILQVIRPDLLKKGFEKVAAENLEVTDDVSIIEQLPAPVKITVGEYTNIKVRRRLERAEGLGLRSRLGSRQNIKVRRRLERVEGRVEGPGSEVSNSQRWPG